MNQLLSKMTDFSGAELTNTLIPGDESFEYPEWSEDAKLDGRPVRIYYRTTPADQKVFEETNDHGAIDWERRVTEIVEVLEDGCDGETLWRSV